MSTMTCHAGVGQIGQEIMTSDFVGQLAGAETAPSDDLPCRVANPDLWFAENPSELETAKSLCIACPVRARCLAAALDRAEPWGVWGGEILDQGVIVQRKRGRGRPRKVAAESAAA